MKSKKLLAIALALCTLLSVLVLPTSAAIDDQNRYYTNVIIYTPQGTPVSVMIRTGELKTTEIAAAIAVKARYEAEGARMLSENDLHFNCFSFAFLDQDILENNYWMADPTEFVTDGSFVEIDTPVQGCVAVYCNMNRFYFILKAENADGTYSEINRGYLSDALNEVEMTHAGIVVGVQTGEDGVIDGDDVEMISKWGIGGVYRHTINASPYAEMPEIRKSPITSPGLLTELYTECYEQCVKYYVPNPALYADQTLKTGRTGRQGLYKDADGIRYYVKNVAMEAGVVSDAAGNYYYIDSSLKAVTDNDSVLIPLNKTNGLIPDGVYSIDENGYITNLPTVLVGESIRDGVVKTADGQIKTMENGYPTVGLGAYYDGTDYYYFDDTPVEYGAYADGTPDFDALTTDGAYKGTVSGAANNGILPVYGWSVDENGKITAMPAKLDSQTKNFGTGLMRLPDGTIVLYVNGVPQLNATSYTDPATGKKYNFTYGGTTYSVASNATTSKVSARLSKKAA